MAKLSPSSTALPSGHAKDRSEQVMEGIRRGYAAPPPPAHRQALRGDFCTVARWDDGQIVEENLFYDLVTFMRQLGLSG